MVWWLRVLPLLMLMTAGPNGGGATGAGATGSGGATGAGSGDSNNQDATADDSVSDDTGDDDIDDDDEDDDDTASANKRTATGQFEKGFHNLLERFGGNGRRAAEHLYRLNYRGREKARLLAEEIDTLKRQLPGKGRTVLPQREADELKAYRALGKPNDIRSRLNAADQAVQELDTHKKDSLLRDVAEVEGYNFKALKGAASDVQYAVREVEADGKKQRRAFVITRNGDQTQETPVKDWFAQNRDYLLPALTATTDGNNRQQPQGYGQPFVAQPVPQQRSANNGQVPSAASAVVGRYVDPTKIDQKK